jgi:hypothetical protein
VAHSKSNRTRIASKVLLTLAAVAAAAFAAPEPATADIVGFCQVNLVGEFLTTNPRMAVGCSTPIQVCSVGGAVSGCTGRGGTVRNISWLSMSSTATAASRLQAVATTAMLTGKPLLVDLPGVAGILPAGCQSTDCRVPLFFAAGP